MNLVLSLIIPVYNIEEYLPICLSSIVSQKNINIEVILINDGSQDNSGKIADKYAKNYDYIQVIHQKNQGVSLARNNGLKIAKGEYIWFVDGDDMVAEYGLIKLCKYLSQYKPDAIFFKHQVFNFMREIKKIECSGKIKEENFSKVFTSFLNERKITYSPWDKVFKKQILLDNQLYFHQSVSFGEDYLWCSEVFAILQNILIVEDCFYLYRYNRLGSATTEYRDRDLLSSLDALKISIDRILNNKFLNTSLKKDLLIYSSQIFFYNLPLLYSNKLLTKSVINDLKLVWKVYADYQVNLLYFNRGAKIFFILNKFFPWSWSIKIYSSMILFKRYFEAIV